MVFSLDPTAQQLLVLVHLVLEAGDRGVAGIGRPRPHRRGPGRRSTRARRLPDRPRCHRRWSARRARGTCDVGRVPTRCVTQPVGGQQQRDIPAQHSHAAAGDGQAGGERVPLGVRGGELAGVAVPGRAGGASIAVTAFSWPTDQQPHRGIDRPVPPFPHARDTAGGRDTRACGARGRRERGQMRADQPGLQLRIRSVAPSTTLASTRRAGDRPRRPPQRGRGPGRPTAVQESGRAAEADPVQVSVEDRMPHGRARRPRRRGATGPQAHPRPRGPSGTSRRRQRERLTAPARNRPAVNPVKGRAGAAGARSVAGVRAGRGSHEASLSSSAC